MSETKNVTAAGGAEAMKAAKTTPETAPKAPKGTLYGVSVGPGDPELLTL